MTSYAGQTVSGQIVLLDSEREAGLTPEMLFTERDRRNAYADLQTDIPTMRFDLYQRLYLLAEKGSHQAQWYVDKLHEKAREQGRAIIEGSQDNY